MKFSLTFAVLAANVGSAVGQTIFEAIEATGNYTDLLGALNATGAIADIEELGEPVTIFGPTDAAFLAINGTVADLNDTQLLDVLAGHVVIGEFDPAVVVGNGCTVLETLAGTFLTVELTDDDFCLCDPIWTVNGARVVSPPISGEGGVFWGIDEVLLPGNFTPCDPSFIDLAVDTGDFGILIDYANSTGAIQLLDNQRYTVFGPTNAAFGAAAETLSSYNTSQLVEILRGHVVAGVYKSVGVMEAGCVELATAVGTMLQVAYTEEDNVPMVTVNGIPVIEPDLIGPDGVFHGIEGVILPGSFTPCPNNMTNASSIIELAAEAGNYTTLLDALNSTPGAAEALEQSAPVTVFGPTDAAFAALGDEFTDLAGQPDLLLALLGGHVVAGAYTVADVKAEGCMEIETVVGTMVKVEYDESHTHDSRALADHIGMEGTVLVNGIHVVGADLVGFDGVFQGIDGVITPDSFSPCPGGESPEAPPAATPTAAPGDSAASVVGVSITVITTAVAATFAL
eukprot:scaffold2125_cov126-Cylindrotheca_fusiformis.AAC.7